ncbi:unnamed protein product [Cuscuta campestris]|uniref:Retrotransposon gag domain-containing protein n=1 Tax=Cuscuta campestris TaxID=132261 RepID=A0A484K896_9ASTE|nr:unnamed protein product [Cuscuta campestris]
MQQLNHTVQQVQRDISGLLARVEKHGDDSGNCGGGRGPDALHGGHPTSRLKIDMPKCDGTDPLGVAEANLQSLFHAGLKSHLQHEMMLQKPESLSASFALARELEAKHAAWASSLPQRPTPWGKPGPVNSAPPLLPTPGTKPPAAASFPQPPIRRLSRVEKLERDSKGLCYNCDEKWTKGHSCGRFLLLIEDDDDTPEQPAVDDTVLTADVSSLNSMAGVSTPRSLRLSGMLADAVVEVLIDGGSTHNFIHPVVVEKLQLPVHDVPAFRVYVGNGASLLCNTQCRDLLLLLQGTTFPVDVYVLSIHGPDIVLGVQWLQLLGRVTHDYAKLTMEFSWKGAPVSLCGSIPTPKPVSVHHFHTLYADWDIAACFEITVAAQEVPTVASDFQLPEGLPAAIRGVLTRYKAVFGIPSGLPPRRLADHRIFLQPGSDPVNAGCIQSTLAEDIPLAFDYNYGHDSKPPSSIWTVVWGSGGAEEDEEAAPTPPPSPPKRAAAAFSMPVLAADDEPLCRNSISEGEKRGAKPEAAPDDDLARESLNLPFSSTALVNSSHAEGGRGREGEEKLGRSGKGVVSPPPSPCRSHGR